MYFLQSLASHQISFPFSPPPCTTSFLLLYFYDAQQLYYYFIRQSFTNIVNNRLFGELNVTNILTYRIANYSLLVVTPLEAFHGTPEKWDKGGGVIPKLDFFFEKKKLRYFFPGVISLWNVEVPSVKIVINLPKN